MVNDCRNNLTFNFEVTKMAELVSDDVDEIVILASSTTFFCICALLFNDLLKKKRRHSVKKASFCLGSRLLAALR